MTLLFAAMTFCSISDQSINDHVDKYVKQIIEHPLDKKLIDQYKKSIGTKDEKENLLDIWGSFYLSAQELYQEMIKQCPNIKENRFKLADRCLFHIENQNSENTYKLLFALNLDQYLSFDFITNIHKELGSSP